MDMTKHTRWIGTACAMGLALSAGCSDDETTPGGGTTTMTGSGGTGAQHTGGGGTGGGGTAGTGGGSGGSGGSVPCGDLLVETVASATTIAAPGGPVPAPGAPFTIAETGVTVTRISDADDPDASSSDYTNGYSRWSPANVTGEYVTAFGTDGRSAIYRLSDRTIVRAIDVGEPNELHWDSSGVGGTETTLYYRVGAELRRMDALVGDEQLVHDFTAEFPTAQVVLNGVEGAPSRDMQYWAFQICAGMSGGGQCTGLIDIVVYDLQADAVASRLSDVESNIPTPNYVEMSPSGSRIVVASCKESGSTPAPWNGPYAWSRDFSSNVRLSTNCTHSGWAWGSGGEELHVAFDSCGASNEEVTPTCDYLMAVDVNDPQGWDNRIGILYQGDLGWGIGNHIGRIYDSQVRGWFLMSTYSDQNDWSANQLLFIELVEESALPRLWRVAPTLNAFEGYWSEAFASLDFGARRVYWGANWSGADNLELYQAQLCDSWWEALAAR